MGKFVALLLRSMACYRALAWWWNASRQTRTQKRVVAHIGISGRGGLMVRRILCIDGGGIKGVVPASFLAAVEDSLGESVSRYFDLIVGTLTGGIIAIGLGLGLSARQILEFYEVHGPDIFRGDRRLLALRWLLRAKYDSTPLRTALHDVFADRLFGESSKRLVVPSFNVGTGDVHVWKTAHHPRFERDHKCQAIEVAQ